MKGLTTLFVIGMVLTTVAMADDVDDIKAAEMAHFVALSAGNANGYVQHHSPELTRFIAVGLGWDFGSLEEQRNQIQTAFDAGSDYNLGLRHLEVKVYGDAAVATSYVVGTVARPNGTTEQAVWRRSAFWIKQGGGWEEVHFHQSPLRFPQ